MTPWSSNLVKGFATINVSSAIHLARLSDFNKWYLKSLFSNYSASLSFLWFISGCKVISITSALSKKLYRKTPELITCRDDHGRQKLVTSSPELARKYLSLLYFKIFIYIIKYNSQSLTKPTNLIQIPTRIWYCW